MSSAWPDAVVGVQYEHADEVGECIDTNESGFGHKWGLLRFEDGREQWVRTVLLTAVLDDAQGAASA